jgi:hypothetical protein
MSVKKAFSYGALAGVGLAILLMLLDWIRPFPPLMNAYLERATFRFCPLFVMGFSSDFHTWSAVVAVTILGNAVLYGVFGVFLSLVYRAVRWGAQQVPH